MSETLEKIFLDAPLRKPCSLQTDKKKKFSNSSSKAIIKQNDIQHFASKGFKKAAVTMRFNSIYQNPNLDLPVRQGFTKVSCRIKGSS